MQKVEKRQERRSIYSNKSWYMAIDLKACRISKQILPPTVKQNTTL